MDSMDRSCGEAVVFWPEAVPTFGPRLNTVLPPPSYQPCVVPQKNPPCTVTYAVSVKLAMLKPFGPRAAVTQTQEKRQLYGLPLLRAWPHTPRPPCEPSSVTPGGTTSGALVVYTPAPR